MSKGNGVFPKNFSNAIHDKEDIYVYAYLCMSTCACVLQKSLVIALGSTFTYISAQYRKKSYIRCKQEKNRCIIYRDSYQLNIR